MPSPRLPALRGEALCHAGPDHKRLLYSNDRTCPAACVWVAIGRGMDRCAPALPSPAQPSPGGGCEKLPSAPKCTHFALGAEAFGVTCRRKQQMLSPGSQGPGLPNLAEPLPLSPNSQSCCRRSLINDGNCSANVEPETCCVAPMSQARQPPGCEAGRELFGPGQARPGDPWTAVDTWG